MEEGSILPTKKEKTSMIGFKKEKPANTASMSAIIRTVNFKDNFVWKPTHENPIHWGQAKTYAYIYALDQDLEEIDTTPYRERFSPNSVQLV